MDLTLVPSLELLLQRKDIDSFSGKLGDNRATESPFIQAVNDFEALEFWLNTYENSRTRRSYQKEVERLLLWSIISRRKALSSLEVKDMQSYFEFVDDPQPRDFWVNKNPGQSTRGSHAWRPFQGRLSHTAKQQAKTILFTFFDYLVDARYLKHNPLKLIKIKRAPVTAEVQKTQVKKRILQPDEWQAMLTTMSDYPEVTRHQQDEKTRLKFIVAMLYTLGLRVSELCQASWDQFYKDDIGWWFSVIGKGQKMGVVPVNHSLLQIIRKYRLQIGLTAFPQQDNSKVLISWKGKNGLTERSVSKLLKNLATQTSEKFQHDPVKQMKLAKFSPHWLRHLSATMQSQLGISEEFIQENLRHSNIATTRIYMHNYDEARHVAAQQLIID